MKRSRRKLSPKQRALLERAVAGEDYEYPERYYGPYDWRPAGRWFVPKSGSAEYSASRVLAARGLLRPDSVAPCKELPYGQGGYSITPRGRKELSRCA